MPTEHSEDAVAQHYPVSLRWGVSLFADTLTESVSTGHLSKYLRDTIDSLSPKVLHKAGLRNLKIHFDETTKATSS